MKKPLGALALASVSALVLAGCSAAPTAHAGADDGVIQVVASTNVYGALAEQIGGDRVDVTSIITSASQDPHSHEASARDRLTVRDAELIIENGGGYDSFMDTLIADSDVRVFTAASFSNDYPGNEGDDDAEGFNEHVWFDPYTMIHVVEGIAADFSEIDPDGEADFTAAAAEIGTEFEGFGAELETIGTEARNASVFITEPLPGYIATAAGLVDVTPEGFAETVEEGADVAPATLLAALDVIEGGGVKALLTNAQTGGAETERVEEAAEAAGIPVVAFTELLEDGSSYSEWMRDAIQDLDAALQK
ncbi:MULTISPECIES: metal ABC transporter solute-binding protein, Zn/Mn family [Microbacterium]|uniref:metal ABC transporter solute-binding protein, Zn/Mn family n=1 Tax=Microbacterium TaxID=33882 RepID=UPI00051A3358|nr:zinc ABC transporter substrate-binding protein [Microbacterium profundi]